MGRRAPAGAQVKLGPSFFIPNGQLGSFGAVTPVRSMVRKRRDLFDVSVAGPAAAGAASLALFLAGLAMSRGGDAVRTAACPSACVPPPPLTRSLA